MVSDFESESSQLKELVEKLEARDNAAQVKLAAAAALQPRVDTLMKSPDYLSSKFNPY